MAERITKPEDQEGGEAGVQAFRDQLGPFVVAADTTRMAMIFTDAQVSGHPIVFVNDSFLALTGYEREEVLGQDVTFMLARGADRRAIALIEAAFTGEVTDGTEIVYRRKDGSRFWSAVLVSPVRDQAGAIVQHFASFVDLTKHKQEQAQSVMLIDELNHRVKNTLATVQSIVSQALRSNTDPVAIRSSIESRLFALSRSHDLLTRENWNGAGLLDLVSEAMEPFGFTDGRAERFVITGRNIRLPTNATLALGIAFHELATNAVKYGAFSNEVGFVRLGWSVEAKPDGDRMRLRWQEEDGPPVARPTRVGFGSRVIERGLAHELEGHVHLEYPVDGVVCTIDFPAPADARHE